MATKRVVLNAVKVIAGLAAVVFWFCPLGTSTQVLLFIGSIAVLLICLAISGGLDDTNTGYWPEKPPSISASIGFPHIDRP